MSMSILIGLLNLIIEGDFKEYYGNLKKNKFIDQSTKKKIPDETIRLLEIQKNMMIKQLIQLGGHINS